LNKKADFEILSAMRRWISGHVMCQRDYRVQADCPRISLGDHSTALYDDNLHPVLLGFAKQLNLFDVIE
jgi:hypothetical protein